MTYDDWKLETPEEEDYRLGAVGRKRMNRAMWEIEEAKKRWPNTPVPERENDE